MKTPKLKISIVTIVICLFSTNLWAQFPTNPGSDPLSIQEKVSNATPITNRSVNLIEEDSSNTDIENQTPPVEMTKRKLQKQKKYKHPVLQSVKTIAVKKEN